MHRFALLVLASLCTPACAPPTGSERGDCYPNHTCNRGLSCMSERCVLIRDDGGADDIATTDTLTGNDASSDSQTPADDVSLTDPTFTRDMVPFFTRSCGNDTSTCHARSVYNADRALGCRGWLSLENVTLGSTFNSGPQSGQPTGCPDRTLYERLLGEASQTCGGTPPRLIVPGDPNNSYLFRKIDGGPYCPSLITGRQSAAMPMVGVLTSAEIDRVRRWIANGAPQ